ncbi:MAG: hypothetical protein RIM99_09475 [Cyclobacteriaceae bacterium]
MRKAILILMIFCLNELNAQTDSTARGEVVDAEIVIEKDKKIILPVAEKINLAVEMKDFGQDPLSLTYKSIEPDFAWPDYKSEVGFSRFNKPYPSAKYQNYIKAGYGNYSSPLLDVGLFIKLESIRLGSRLYHESFAKGPVSDENSASSVSSFDFAADYRKKSFVLRPVLNYNRNGYRFYGNTDRLTSGFSSDQLDKASWSTIDFTINLTGEGKELTYFIRPKLTSATQTFINGRDINKESGLEFESGLALKLDKTIKAGLNFEGYTGKYEGGLEYNRSLFQINPWVSHTSDEIKLVAGFILASRKTDDVESESGFYPSVFADWKFTDKWSLFGSLKGGVEWNSLNSLLSMNQFLDDSLVIGSSELTSSFGGGVKGSPINNFTVKVGISLDNYSGLPFFVPSQSDSSTFTLTYDSETVNIFRYSGEAVLSLSSEAEVRATLDLFGYSVKSLEKAWHKPSYEFSIYYSHFIKRKILLTTHLVAVGGIRAPLNEAPGFTKLSAFADLNIAADYKITDRASVFMKLNNLLNNEYEKYLGYPVRGTSFKLGAGYRF